MAEYLSYFDVLLVCSRFQINWEIMGQIYVAFLANLNITEKVDRYFKLIFKIFKQETYFFKFT